MYNSIATIHACVVYTNFPCRGSILGLGAGEQGANLKSSCWTS